MTRPNHNALALVESLGSSEFWGNLTLRFQRGQVVHITKEESIQPTPDNRRSYDQYGN